MSIRSHVASLAAIIVILGAAAPSLAQDQDSVQARVKAGDLNLRSPAGRATLNGRLDRAANAACGDSDGSLAGAQDSARCHDQMVRSGNVQANGIAAQQKARAIVAHRRTASRAHHGVTRHHRVIHHRRHHAVHRG